MEPEEREKLLETMNELSKRVYWAFFHAGIGQTCHAFIEFNGVLSKYVDLCRKAHEAGIDFTQANTHNDIPFPCEAHDMAYLGEKLGCIFGPALRANPKAKRAFLEAMLGEAA